MFNLFKSVEHKRRLNEDKTNIHYCNRHLPISFSTQLADNYLVVHEFQEFKSLSDLFASHTYPFLSAFSRDFYHPANCRHLRRVCLQNFSDGPGCDDGSPLRHLHLHRGLLRRAPESSQEAQPLITISRRTKQQLLPAEDSASLYLYTFH